MAQDDTLLQSSRTLDRIIVSIGDLPASPAIVSTLMSLTADVNADIEKMCHPIMADQALAAKLLKLSNSSFYGRAKEVRTLREAVVILGFKTLRSLVVASSTHSLYQNIIDPSFRDRLWDHSLATALAARLIARALGHPHAEEAFIAGLMHDIGKLVLYQKLVDEYRAVVQKVEAERRPFIEIEEEVFGFNHTDVGLLLLHKWAFPQILSNAVFEHHSPIDAGEQPLRLAFIVNMANLMAKNLGIGFADSRPDGTEGRPPIPHLGLDDDSFHRIEENLRDQFETERQLYRDSLPGPQSKSGRII